MQSNKSAMGGLWFTKEKLNGILLNGTHWTFKYRLDNNEQGILYNWFLYNFIIQPVKQVSNHINSLRFDSE